MKWQFSPKAIHSIRESLKPKDIFPSIYIWHGAVRSSKTMTSLIPWSAFVRNHASSEFPLLMVGKTERTLYKNILLPLEQMVGEENFKLTRGTGKLKLFDRDIALVGANDARAETKIRGQTYGGVYVDEATITPEEFFLQAKFRCSVEGSKIFVTTNPDAPSHWLKVNFIDKADNYEITEFQFELADNPSLPEGFLKSLHNTYAGLFKKRFIYGQWVMASGAVYESFDENVHVVPLPKDFYSTPKTFYLSVDPAISSVCAAGLFCKLHVDTKPDILHLKTYYYDAKEKGQITDAQHAQNIKKFVGNLPIKHVVVDPESPAFALEMRKVGFRTVNAKKSVVDGISVQSSLLESGNYRVVNHPSNVPVIREYESYVWDEKAQARGEDKPVKKNDHILDSTRYFLFTTFGHYLKPTSDKDMRYFI